jgi:hypothetical protein
MTIDRILSSPESSFTHAKTLKMIEELSGRVQDHLRSVYFMHVPKGKADYYRTYPFDTRVSERFPSATFDIEEAGKCYALARHTACVMHLMRVVEIGLRTYGTALGVTASIAAARPNWNDVLRVANDEILRLNRSGDATWTPEKRSFFEGLHPYFHAIRIAWRNTTMHVENRYDEERAGEIFNAVKSWMRYMSTHLDEAGTFTP